ncbi:Gag-pol Polyprotein [Phytophthora megakarya]|uniref:Gag-pol Polyprotein n=1 Tax=Phytophthora megakarya TaxID=4795 RepID=A0A225V160_9STRA|nr:Gag-pol Polyprotein [Phytophthora megakarya]
MWLRGLYDELMWNYDIPTLWCDNTAALALSKRPGKHNGSKHIENRYHYVRNLGERKLIAVRHCRTDQMTADIFTKPLARVKFAQFRGMLGVCRRGQEGGATTADGGIESSTMMVMFTTK